MPKNSYDLNIAVCRYLYRCLVEDDEEELTRAGMCKPQYYVLESEKFFIGSAKFRQSPAVNATVSVDWRALATQQTDRDANAPLSPRSLRLRLFVLQTAKLFRQLMTQLNYRQLHQYGVEYEDMKYIVSGLPHTIRPSTNDVRIRLQFNSTRSLRLRQTAQESLNTAVKILQIVRNHGTGQMVSDLFGLDQHDYRYARKICHRSRRGRHQPLSIEQQHKLDQVLMQTCYAGTGPGVSFRMPSLSDYLRIYADDPNIPFWAMYNAARQLYDHHKQTAIGDSKSQYD